MRQPFQLSGREFFGYGWRTGTTTNKVAGTSRTYYYDSKQHFGRGRRKSPMQDSCDHLIETRNTQASIFTWTHDPHKGNRVRPVTVRWASGQEFGADRIDRGFKGFLREAIFMKNAKYTMQRTPSPSPIFKFTPPRPFRLPSHPLLLPPFHSPFTIPFHSRLPPSLVTSK
ncbi:hypothetical protein PISMIDRAFT_360358 [Pisolithus microcarpus 441]|uniref:Uncharacterized protein n=1 Tax=Pisolithus microcarpus 441 TaxID=765257 RepID=A0A0C9ZS12_9AGAM|nr:hypothetical protein PISMIDRAFT_360358 [Pisolithus microcarpus 441]